MLDIFSINFSSGVFFPKKDEKSSASGIGEKFILAGDNLK